MKAQSKAPLGRMLALFLLVIAAGCDGILGIEGLEIGCPDGCVNQTCVKGVCVGDCEAGRKECDEKTPKVCDDQGRWQRGAACEYACFAGSCDCDPGQGRCVENNTLETCDKERKWKADPCVEQTCFANLQTLTAACKGECSPGKRCLGNTPQVCNVMGKWEDQTPCNANEQCTGGVCACGNGDVRCYENTLQICTGSSWVTKPGGACMNQACDLISQSCIGACAPNAKQCNVDGKTPQTCNESGEWVNEAACSFGCAGGKCVECAEGTSQCKGQQPQTCLSGQWQDVPGGPCTNTCNGGSGECMGVCPPGKRCIGQTPQHCNDVGQWDDDPPCNLGEYCQGGECLLECVPNDLRCWNNTPQACNAMKQWQDIGSGPCEHSTCNPTTVQCEGDCAPDEKQCVGDIVQTCDSSGYWQDDVSCPNGCLDGKCLVTCDDNLQNGDETDIDCGGPACSPCGVGAHCSSGSDCINPICSNGSCAPPTCADGIWNGEETDVDCGGQCLMNCADFMSCNVSGDCMSGVCKNAMCQPANCTDVTKNGSETGIDCGGACPKCADGINCTLGDDCINGVCSNGICVSSQCNDLVKNGAESDTDCGGPVCQGCDAGMNCWNSTDCKTNICTAGVCQRKPNGMPCIFKAECVSDHCVDGVCCNNACTGLCEACTAQTKGNGSDGVCGPNIAGTDPESECATDSPMTCGTTGKCNGSGACAFYPSTTICGPATCKDVVTKQSVQFCNGVGACWTSMEESCVPYTCSAGQCLTTCALDTQCAGGFYCLFNQCVAKKPDGLLCVFTNECLSGNCADGRCCNSACSSICQACNLPGLLGTCSNVALNQDDVDTCAGTMQSCDGVGNCKQENGQACTTNVGCFSGNCVDGVCCNSACAGICQACNVAGAVGTCSSLPLGAFDSTSGCFGDKACDGVGSCKKLNGEVCTDGLQCVSGNCVDGVCCSSASCGTCQTCNKNIMMAGTCVNLDANQIDPYPVGTCTVGRACDGNGTCKNLNGGACTLGSECLSNKCVDGVCCNVACTGTCQACSVAKKGSGIDGLCAAIAINTDPDNECADAATCDGIGACQP